MLAFFARESLTKWLATWTGAALVIAGLTGVIAPSAEATISSPSDDQVVLAAHVYGDRVNDTGNGVGGMAGATLQLRDSQGSAVTTCTSDADGDCSFVVPVASLPDTPMLSYFATIASLPPGWTEVATASSVGFAFPLPTTGGGKYKSQDSIILQRVNPAVLGACGQDVLKVAIVVDLSDSMNGTSGTPPIDILKTAAKGYVDILATTDAQVGLFTFSTSSPAPGGGNANRPVTPAASGAAKLKGWIDGWQPNGWTNWDAGLWAVASSDTKFNLVIFITDGEPTASTTDDLVFDNVASANAVKAKGTRIIAIGAGPSFSQNAIKHIARIAGSDYFLADDWASVEHHFKDLPTQCDAPSTSTVSIRFVDDVTGAEVPPVAGFDPTLVGLPGDKVKFDQADAERGFDNSLYAFASMNSVAAFTEQAQTITVRLAHKMATADVDVTRTVNYTGAGDKTPADRIDTVPWLMTTDLATGQATCTTVVTGYPAVESPQVKYYTPDPATIPALFVTSPAPVCPPADITETVRYTEIQDAHISIGFFDDVTGQDVAPANGFNTVLIGKPGDLVGFTADDAKPGFDATKYVLGAIDNVDTFTADDQIITVHLTHKLAHEDVDVTRTIHYTGASDKMPADHVDVIAWKQTTDLATGSSQCVTTAPGYPGVTSPVIAGYTVDPAEVAASVVISPSDICPANTHVTVKYTKVPAPAETPPPDTTHVPQVPAPVVTSPADVHTPNTEATVKQTPVPVVVATGGTPAGSLSSTLAVAAAVGLLSAMLLGALRRRSVRHR